MKQTPMLQQYLELKASHQDAMLLYRLGDFYELFFEDAQIAAPLLGLVLTRRRHNDEVTSPMCGIPHHAQAGYVGRLLEAGHKIAIAEQVEDPASAGGLVRREVVRILTPGTVTEPELLADGERRWVVALVPDGHVTALAYLDVASGVLGGAACSTPEELRELLAQLRPREVLVAEATDPASLWPRDLELPVLTRRPGAWFAPARGEEVLRSALGVGSLRAFELEPGEALVGAAGALVEYLRETQGQAARHLGGFERRHRTAELFLDAATVRNLELLRDASGERRASLMRILDHTVTPMGSRLLREWLLRPLADSAAASLRHEAVGWLQDEPAALGDLRDRLARLGDLERTAARLGLKQLRPGELAGLRAALGQVPGLRAAVIASPCQLMAALGEQVDPLDALEADLQVTLAEDPPAVLGPGTIRTGVDPVLDEARRLSRSAKEVLGEIEARERAATGISNLKIKYNRVFGYAFEVSRSNLDRVPEGWTRKQTLAGAERYVTVELAELERRILGAETDAEEREKELYAELSERGAGFAGRLAATAHALAAVDVLGAFAERARRCRYCRPQLVAGARVRLVGSRHPVVEEVSSQPFIPNDVELDGNGRQIVILTGPNMGGKSTFLRQVALAVIMARAGSFVAAEEAEIGEIDRVFTRVGAADDLARGESTFMVEMTEVSRILRQATARSLVILDEVGRGTATFDGLSLAWAVVEALHDPPLGERGPLVIFATHYHELTDLAERLERVVNASVAVKEWQGHVLFLHRVVAGPSDRSYGIHVARLAGVPEATCTRARAILKQLERHELRVVEATAPARAPRQLPLFPAGEEIVAQRLRSLRLDSLTPLDALNLLAELKRELDS